MLLNNHSNMLAAILIFLSFSSCVHSRCYDPTPAFPPFQSIDPNSIVLREAFEQINSTISSVTSPPNFDTSSFSIEVTSSTETLWGLHHTARDRDENRPGAKQVDGDSVYRIASISKVFTVLGILQLQAAGNLSLDDTVDKHIPELRQKQSGTIPWDSITLRSLASQLSGIQREFIQAELLVLDDPGSLGLPPISSDGLPNCQFNSSPSRPCARKDLLDTLLSHPPVFAPNQQSTYSNVAFDLLGLVIENASGFGYSSYIDSHIFSPLDMTHSSLVKPSDSIAVLPKSANYWDAEEGVERPTGGIYSSSHDLSLFLRHLLTSNNTPNNHLNPEYNWLLTSSPSGTASSFFGTPWEIYRPTSASLLPHSPGRPVNFVTKSGGVPGYFSIIILLPEYNVGVTILVGGDSELKEQLIEIVTVPLVRALEELAQTNLAKRYTGRFVAAGDLNSSLTLSHDPARGLQVTDFVSNGTNLFFPPPSSSSLPSQHPALFPHHSHLPFPPFFSTPSDPWRAQLVPTLLHRHPDNQTGELWRIINVPGTRQHEQVWDDFCITNIDPLFYGGKPLLELVFWEGEDGEVESVEATGFRVVLEREKEEEDGDKKTAGEERRPMGDRMETGNGQTVLGAGGL